jgi:DNA-binding NtrC family response regulator/tetratricopeptide (TPR) repeat protein
VAEPFEGRFRLADRLADCGRLPRYRVIGVTLAEPAEAIALAETGRWGGLLETVWLRVARLIAHPAAACVPFAAEQAGDTLLVIHPVLPSDAWGDHARDLPADVLFAEIATLVHWLIAGLAAQVGCGNLRLSALRWSAGGPLASPAAWVVPLSLLAGRGLPGRPWRGLVARGWGGEAALDAGLLCHDLAGLLGERLAEELPDGSMRDRPADRSVLTRVRDGLVACSVAARVGGEAGPLGSGLADLLALVNGTDVPSRVPRNARAPVRDTLAAALAALGRREDGTCLFLAGGVVEGVVARIATALPATAEFTVARGLVAEQPTPGLARAGRQGVEAWLVVCDDRVQPPTAARRWLAGVPAGCRRRVLWLGTGEGAPAGHLLRRDLIARWRLTRLEESLSGEAPLPPEPAVVLGPAPPMEPGERVLLGMVAAAGIELPLPLLGRASGLQSRELGVALASLVARGQLVWRAVRANWMRAEWTCTVAVTPAGLARAAADLVDVEHHRGCLALLLHHLPPGRGADDHWLRFHLLAAAGNSAGAARELAALLAIPSGAQDDHATVAACAAALAPEFPCRLDPVLLIRACRRLGRAWEERSQLDEARAAYARGLLFATGLVDGHTGEEEAEALAELAIAYADLLDKRGEFAVLNDLLWRVVDGCGGSLRPPLAARLQFEIAWSHHRMGRHEAALEICQALLRQLDIEGCPAEAGDVHNLIGLVRYESSRYEEARISIQKGLVLRERAGDQAAVARSCNNLGLVHRALGDLARAEACLQRSLAIKSTAGDLSGVASCFLNMAYIALDQERFESALERGRQALDISRAQVLRQLEAEILLLLGEVAEAQGRYAEATGEYAGARAIAEEIDDADQCLAVLRHQAGLALREGEATQAWSTFREAEALALRVPSQLQRALLRQLAGDLHTASHRHAEAATAYEECAHALVALHKTELQIRAKTRAALAHAHAGELQRARDLFGELRRGTLDMRLSALPPEFHELEKLLGQTGGEDSGAPADAILLRGLLSLPALEAQRPGFPACARRVVELLHVAGSFAAVGFVHLSPTGEELGRWEQGDPSGAEGPTFVARDVWPDGAEIVGTGVLARNSEGPGRRRAISSEEARGALALATVVLAACRARIEEGRRQSASPVSPVPVLQAATFPPGVAFVGTSEALADLRRFVDKVANLDVPVLILGENGSGKELVARLIHSRGARRQHGFVAVNCASIPATLLESTLFGHERGAFTDAVVRRIGEFEQAGSGTILLDEIGEMPVPLQTKLLRVLQEKEFRRVGGSETLRLRARVLAATNLDIGTAVADGRFREDLYYRLAVLPVRVPPLRERPEDITPLLRHFLEIYALEFGVPVCEISAEALDVLVTAPWRGNVRELQNLVRRLLIFAEGRPVRCGDLPASLQALGDEPPDVGEDLTEIVARLVRVRDLGAASPLLPRLQGLLARQMVACCASKAEAARRLGITAPTLYEWLRREGAQEAGPPRRQQSAEG